LLYPLHFLTTSGFGMGWGYNIWGGFSTINRNPLSNSMHFVSQNARIFSLQGEILHWIVSQACNDGIVRIVVKIKGFLALTGAQVHNNNIFTLRAGGLSCIPVPNVVMIRGYKSVC